MTDGENARAFCISFFPRYSAASAAPAARTAAAASAVKIVFMSSSPWMTERHCAKLAARPQGPDGESAYASIGHVSRRQPPPAGSVRQPPHLRPPGREAYAHGVQRRRQGFHRERDLFL